MSNEGNDSFSILTPTELQTSVRKAFSPCAALPNKEHIPLAMAFIQFNSITKRFPGVLALDGLSFGVERGSCHTLMGETGAGHEPLAMLGGTP